MNNSIYEKYQLIFERNIEDLNSVSVLLQHKKSGARVALLKNDDKNKVFYIGFRTPPKDSTGVAHIVEHTVLCGSKLFPLKDPFVELVKGSLNTFLNAMTFPDKTVYPVASCNDKDFKNLMHVYMDAVFYPNIYTNEKIFMQEGWHYEMNDIEDDIRINGVVYNEMKGAFSSSDDVNDREILNSLYPDTAYGVESGGDPDNIPDLTYEGFLDFHGKYYHPSNSYIYLYGDMDFEERLNWLDKEYLSAFDRIEVDSFPGNQKAFDEPIFIEKNYPISDDDDVENNTYLSCNSVVGVSLDKMLYVAFQVIDYALVEAQGAPLKQALLDAGIGSEVYSMYENGIYQPYFSIVAKNANKSDEEDFRKIIETTLSKVVSNGFDKNALLAGINTLEFRYRESDFGSYPRGLMLGLMSFDTWLYDDSKPFDNIELNETFCKLRELAKTDYFEKLIDEYLISNSHKSFVTLCPEKGLTAKKDAKLAKKLKDYRDSLSQDELRAIVEQTKALKEYQDKPDAPEDLAKIPMLTREDLDKKSEKLIYEETSIDGVKTLFHDIFTNEIGYYKLSFDIPHVKPETYLKLSLLKAILGLLDTEHYSYEQYGYEVNKYTGNMYPTLSVSHKYNDCREYRVQFVVCVKCLYSNIGKSIELVKEMLFNTKFDDAKRIKEIIAELKSGFASKIVSSGHSTAMNYGLSFYTKSAYIREHIGGIYFYRYLDDLDKNWDTKKDDFISECKELIRSITDPSQFMIDATMDKKGFDILTKELTGFKDALIFDKALEITEFDLPKPANIGFSCASSINYVALCNNIGGTGYKYTGALKVLKTIMGYDYLWNEVRVKGGAYGCMSLYRADGNFYFVSYRDPNLEKTIEIFKKAPEYIRNIELDDKTITKYIIGTLSNLDMPLNPAGKGERAYAAYLSGVTDQILQEERDEILYVTRDDIASLADYFDTFVSGGGIYVVGNDAKIKENAQLFDEILPLI